MKKTKKQTSNHDLSPSLLIVKDDLRSSDILNDIVKNKVSSDIQMLIQRWEDVVSEHTKNWSEKQWKAISTQDIWDEVTARIKSPESMHFIRHHYDGTIHQYILHEGHMLETTWTDNDWGYIDRDSGYLRSASVPHERTVVPIMLKALINVAIKHHQNNQTLIPFAATSANILKEYGNLAHGFVESSMSLLLKTTPQQSTGDALKTLQEFLPFDEVQPFWIKKGVQYAQAAWINKGVRKDDQDSIRTFLYAVTNLPKTCKSSKYVESLGSVLFGQKVANTLDGNGVGFCKALERFLQIAPIDIKLFEKWCTNPSDDLARNVLIVVGSDEKFAPYTKVMLEKCNLETRKNFIRQLVLENNPANLKAIPQHYIQECCLTHIKDGDLYFVNTLLTNTNTQLDDEHWDVYWGMMESEYPTLGRGLRSMMEKKMMNAAITPSSQTSTKRKM